ncbi:MAG: arylsulfatase, partial [Humisphaera sp.]|nr:arylsulfatase [Humisphaera sp.]
MPATRSAALVIILVAMVLPGTPCNAAPAPSPATTRPNIVFILCDDLGYGDVRAFNPDRCKIATPNIDALAGQGMRFTDAHTSSSVCTPTRYNLLTGRYNWRSKLQRGVLQGNGPPLIAPDRLTVAEMLRKQGYTTAAIGKWHLGLGMNEQRWGDRISDGPIQHGFEKFFGISASLDMPPFAFINDDRFPELPTTRKTWIRTGDAAASFEAVDVLPTLTKRSVDFIRRQNEGDAQPRKPFFLYIALASPHTPIVPTERWAGKSGLGAYGDFVMQTDAAVGEIFSALRDAKLEQNTLVIFTSDNGCSPAAKVKELEAQGHFPSANFRGYKADIWEGGHRVPFIVRWPAVVKPGTQSEQVICLGDFLATCAAITGTTLPDNAGEDSISFLPALRGGGIDSGGGGANMKPRDAIVHHSINGNFAIRQGPWKLALCAGSGGWGDP